MSTLRLLVVGGGHLGRIHAKLAKANDQFELIAVAEPNLEARTQVAQQLAVPTVANYRAVLPQIDAAIVASPTHAHYDIASTLLRSGIHVLVEKPLASTADEANRLVQIARRYQRVLQTGHVERFNPTWLAASPRLNKPKYIEAVRAGAYSGRSTDIGVVMDLMIHDLDLILSLDHSAVEQVSASGIALLGTHEDMAEARLQFASGLIATLKASRLALTATRRMQVFTGDLYADLDFASCELKVIQPNAAVLARQVALDALPAAERMRAKDTLMQDHFHLEHVTAPNRNAILDEQNDFALSVHSGSLPAVTGDDGAKAVEVASRIVGAIAAHGWDGIGSKPWRTGAAASNEPQIIPLSSARVDFVPESIPSRRAG